MSYKNMHVYTYNQCRTKTATTNYSNFIAHISHFMDETEKTMMGLRFSISPTTLDAVYALGIIQPLDTDAVKSHMDYEEKFKYP